MVTIILTQEKRKGNSKYEFNSTEIFSNGKQFSKHD